MNDWSKGTGKCKLTSFMNVHFTFRSWRRLPPAPAISRLSPVVPPITIPAGSYGRYKVLLSSFGVHEARPF